MTTCQFPGCDRPHSCLGLCAAHYKQHRRGTPLRPLGVRVPRSDPSDPALCATCAEVAWLADAGECFERIAERIAMDARSMERHLYRHQRGDLVARIPRLATVPATPYR